MSDTSDLEGQFHEAMVDIYEVAKREICYTATYLLQMVLEHGGLAAARRLLAMGKPSDGFTTLWMNQRLDLSVEAHVIKPEFAALFSPEEIEIAQARLQEYGFEFDK